ncbi:MAG: HDIG domain-containing protein [Sedimentisphaerales bacterium]|nr:HDIG domain-containing protein [Sedimentisphaerales bacterium]
MPLFKKVSARRSHVRKSMATERFMRLSRLADADIIISVLLWLLFVVLSGLVLSFDLFQMQNYHQAASMVLFVVLLSVAGGVYIFHYQSRIIKNHPRALALVGLFVLLLFLAKTGILLFGQLFWATGTAVAAAVILTIAYNQRFATGMSLFYCVLASFAAGAEAGIQLFLIMTTGAFICCFSLKEIRTRTKLLEVSALAAVMVFLMGFILQVLGGSAISSKVFKAAGYHSLSAILVGLLLQSLLPLIEKAFKIVTSMTLLDYSDANQPLLRRLAMEAPGTFSHSLLVGSIAEAAAESIGRNGLLCRVGAYYHDIGKINKPGYFIENELGSGSRHKELSPAMSQLVIIGHVKDGIEIAKEYGLPAVLRQFIETHHGTTLVEYFYNEAKKQHDSTERTAMPHESEFRYAGPRPRAKEAAIVMLADAVEGAVRSFRDVTLPKIEAAIHNISMKRLQDGQFDECDLSLRELSTIEASMTKTLAAHYHARIPYPGTLVGDYAEDSASASSVPFSDDTIPNSRRAQQRSR